MFRRVHQSPAFLYRTRRTPITTARHFHRVTADFINHDSSGNLITEKIPIIVGSPGENYIMVDAEIGNAILTAASQLPVPAPTATSTRIGDTCKLAFFHDSQHFRFESSSYPRLYIPNHISRLTDSNISPATLFADGIMHDIALDGTFDAWFAYEARASARNLKGALDLLKYMLVATWLWA